MIVLYVILGIIIFIFILLHFSIVANVIISNDEKDIKIKYLFFTLYPLKEKPKKNKKIKKNKKKKKSKNKKRKKLEKELEEEKQELDKLLKKAEENKSSEQKSSKEDKDLKEDVKKEKEKIKKTKDKKENNVKNKIEEYKKMWEKIKPYIPLGKKLVKKLIKTIRINDLYLQLAVADEDAYECAMAYGKANMAVFNALSLLKQLFTIKVKKINITSKFNSSQTDYDLKCKIKTRPSTIIAIGFCTLISFINITLKQKRRKIKIKIEKKKEKEMLKNE